LTAEFYIFLSRRARLPFLAVKNVQAYSLIPVFRLKFIVTWSLHEQNKDMLIYTVVGCT